ncbi:class III lanthionine synthetase LanKC [Streptomyces sp. L2]|uniref:class III lanthionine synthetase LanKC n=1 Tax=Streptomyces sp. L2 TaxID=2162665 RepID=UPI001010E52C|nr:class III lanthionine synthetase LanKC [Streptomyces sp. L2]
MDKRYEVYCLANRVFYETPDRLPATQRAKGADARFEATQRPVPEGWRTYASGDWYHLAPVDEHGEPRPGRPRQGWKIHVSACLNNAEKTAAKVWDYCVPRGIPFKFVPSVQLLYLRNSKYAGRGSSGKFATLYPVDESELHQVLQELGELLDGEQGPYILSDLRWNKGPLYVRYGGFAPRSCVDDKGDIVPAIEDPDGRLVPDRRGPAFQPPGWVTLPEFFRPHLDARNATTTNGLPYRIEQALHFSNGGGVYAGIDTRTGKRVVLKEARPYAGLAGDGADAVTRLERERAALEQLGGLGIAPEVRDWLTLGEHRFLVMDFLEGRPLHSFFARRHPLLSPEPEPDDVAAYTRWALAVHRSTEAAVAAVHGRGLVVGDLHPFNIMLAPDERTVQLLDFEAAMPINEHRGQLMAHPGFITPADRKGCAVDHYALACLRIALFLPMTTLIALDRDKAAHLADITAGQFPDLPRSFLDEAVRVIAGDREPGAAPYLPVDPAVRPEGPASIVRAIRRSATPDRDDRLFPGDIAQFADGGGLGMAYGAAGVLYALDETGNGRWERGEEWLLEHTDPPTEGTPLGFYDGLAGVAYLLDRLGHTGRCLELISHVLDEKWHLLGPDLRGGLAGLGLALDHLARTTGEQGLRDHALTAAHILAEMDLTAGKRAGLLRGATGPALLFLRLYESVKDPALLDHAASALRADLARCVPDRTGALGVDEGFRTMPYLATGSVGIGMVLDDYLVHRPDEEFLRARRDILPAARSRYYAEPGLFEGRAGMILYLARTGASRADVNAQTATLGWYAVPYEGELAFPGDQMMRLSMDLATGAAGCLLALGATCAQRPASLPFLPPLPARDTPVAHEPARPGS